MKREIKKVSPYLRNDIGKNNESRWCVDITYYTGETIKGKRLTKRNRYVVGVFKQQVNIEIARLYREGFDDGVTDKENITVTQFIQEYKKFKGDWAPRTKIRNRCVLKKFEAMFGNKEMKSITQLDIEKFKQSVDIQNRKPGGINKDLKLISTLFNTAVEKFSIIPINPVKKVEFKKDPKKLPVFLEANEINKLLNFCKYDFKLYAIFFTFLNTGARKSELTDLTWGDINFERKTISFYSPKTNTTRILSFVDGQEEIFKKLKQMQKDKPSNYVFLNNYNEHINEFTIYQRVKDIFRRLGFKKEYTVHTLRHTFASHLAIDGVSIQKIQKLLGHAHYSMTEIYAQLNDQSTDEAIKHLPSVFTT